MSAQTKGRSSHQTGIEAIRRTVFTQRFLDVRCSVQRVSDLVATISWVDMGYNPVANCRSTLDQPPIGFVSPGISRSPCALWPGLDSKPALIGNSHSVQSWPHQISSNMHTFIVYDTLYIYIYTYIHTTYVYIYIHNTVWYRYLVVTVDRSRGLPFPAKNTSPAPWPRYGQIRQVRGGSPALNGGGAPDQMGKRWDIRPFLGGIKLPRVMGI